MPATSTTPWHSSPNSRPTCPSARLLRGDRPSAGEEGRQRRAEAAFKQAVDADPTKPDGYSELASFYNAQKKFDEANKASAKAAELMSASGSSDPLAIFNQGIILWNQSKAA